MAPPPYPARVAIVGAGGNLGSWITKALLARGKHEVTALTRLESKSNIPHGVRQVNVDYSRLSSIVDALRGQDALIITLGFGAAPGTEELLVQSAAEARVPWILPNAWAPDSTHPGLLRDISSLSKMPPIRSKIRELGVSSYVSVSCGLWYEWCLATPVLYGIDWYHRKATLFDEGETRTSTSTWPQVGRTVAALLSLPVERTGESDICLGSFQNSNVFVESFCISQRDMVDSVLRVTDTTLRDWSVECQPVRERYATAVEATRLGDRQGGRARYSRMFFQDSAGSSEGRTANEALALPVENLDEATKRAIAWKRDGIL